MKLGSIVDSHIITRIIEAFDTQFGTSEKYYIDIEGDIKEYYRWEKDDKVAHLDFDGMNIDITINSIHFNKLSKSYIDKDVEDSYKKKAERIITPVLDLLFFLLSYYVINHKQKIL